MNTNIHVNVNTKVDANKSIGININGSRNNDAAVAWQVHMSPVDRRHILKTLC